MVSGKSFDARWRQVARRGQPARLNLAGHPPKASGKAQNTIAANPGYRVRPYTYPQVHVPTGTLVQVIRTLTETPTGTQSVSG
eukprot:SAG31_NODE_5154_length_2712_cov_1.642174_1_plen_83_part_00